MKAFFVAVCLAFLTACSACAPTLIDRIRTDALFIASTNQIVTRYTIDGESHAKHLQPLIRFAGSKGIPVGEEDMLKEYGYVGLTACQAGRCVILLDKSVSGNTKVYTLLHELAHVRMPINSQAVAEIIAETTAYVAATELGMDVKKQAISYLLRFPEDLRNQTVRSWAPKIELTAKDLVEAARKTP